MQEPFLAVERISSSTDPCRRLQEKIAVCRARRFIVVGRSLEPSERPINVAYGPGSACLWFDIGYLRKRKLGSGLAFYKSPLGLYSGMAVRARIYNG